MIVAKTMMQIILAGLFIGCLLQVPYGYYQFLRLACFVLFAVLAYMEYKRHQYPLTILCVCSSLLFNPLRPIYFDKLLWQQIDKVMASLMLLWITVDVVLFLVQKTAVKNSTRKEEQLVNEELQAEV